MKRSEIIKKLTFDFLIESWVLTSRQAEYLAEIALRSMEKLEVFKIQRVPGPSENKSSLETYIELQIRNNGNKEPNWKSLCLNLAMRADFLDEEDILLRKTIKLLNEENEKLKLALNQISSVDISTETPSLSWLQKWRENTKNIANNVLLEIKYKITK